MAVAPALRTPSLRTWFRVPASCLALPAIWLAGAALEVRQGILSHSLVSRPERLFGPDEAAQRPLLIVLALVAVLAWALLAAGLWTRSDRPRAGAAAGAVLVAAALARLGVTLLAPAGSYLYEVSEGRGISALLMLALLPPGLALAGAAVQRSAPLLAWLSAAAATACLWLAASWTLWSASVGALQPQLWAVEPVEGVAVAWSVTLGAWLLRFPSGVSASSVARALATSRLARLEIPGPGRLSSALVAIVAVAGLISITEGYLDRLGPAIEPQLNGRTQVATIRVDVDRTYRVYRPPVPAGHPGLIVALHGVFSSGFVMEANSHLDAQADRLGWIVAYPDGVLDGWEGFGSGPSWGHHAGADDVAFIHSLIARLESTDGIDPDRVYVTGFSRGGLGTYWLGCQLSSEIAAIAPVAGNMADAQGSADVPCHLAGPVSVLAIHGTADGTIPFAGGKTDIPFSPFVDVIAKWRTWDACAGDGDVARDGASTTTTWQCRDGSAVAMRIVEGGWHWWPAASGDATPRNPDDFDGARLIADFFAAHPRAPR
jgi:polyhydroxybutyrate depolymerase